MGRLIDADVIEKFLDDFADCCGNHQKAVLREVKYALGHMPTIEAEPIRHGRWIFSEDRYWKTCPECGAEVDVSMGLGMFVDGIEVDEMKYCPNCGAKMDEVEE